MEVNKPTQNISQKIYPALKKRWPSLSPQAFNQLSQLLCNAISTKRCTLSQVLVAISTQETPERLCDSLGVRHSAKLIQGDTAAAPLAPASKNNQQAKISKPDTKPKPKTNPSPKPPKPSTKSTNDDEKSRSKTNFQQPSSSSPSSKAAAASSSASDICHEFKRHGTCKNGNKCRFSHNYGGTNTTRTATPTASLKKEPNQQRRHFEHAFGVLFWLKRIESIPDGSELLAALLANDAFQLEDFLSFRAWYRTSSRGDAKSASAITEVLDAFLRIATRDDITKVAVLREHVMRLFALIHAESSEPLWTQLERLVTRSQELVNLARLERICTLCEQMLIRFDDAFRLFGNLTEALESRAVIHSETFRKRIESLQKSRKEARAEFDRKETLLAQRPSSSGASERPDQIDLMEQEYASFRQIPIIPDTQTFFHEGDIAKRHLRPNRVDGSQWRDLDDYLSVHFHLLKEDCMRDLRNNLNVIQSDGGGGDRFLRQMRDVSVYHGIRVQGLEFTRQSILYRVSIDKKSNRSYNWARCKRLLTGSLVALSSDHFQDEILWATVARRDVKVLERANMIDLEFAVGAETALSRADKVYTLVESKTYFEAYSHMMRALQGVSALPFQELILSPVLPEVAINTAGPDKSKFVLPLNPPKYIVENPVMNFASLDPRAKGGVNVLEPRWRELNSTLDESQMASLKHILTSELALVQGPPGTGKTFVGKLATRIILDTIKERNINGRNFGPILCITYTNHALDQFLSGIMQFEPNIVRVGGRCGDPTLAAKTLFELSQNQPKLSRHLGRARFEAIKSLENIQLRIEEKMKSISKDVLSAHHIRSLNPDAAEDFEAVPIDHAVRFWLGVHKPPVQAANQKPEAAAEAEADEDEIKEIEDTRAVEGLEDDGDVFDDAGEDLVVDLDRQQPNNRKRSRKHQGVIMLNRNQDDDEENGNVDAKGNNRSSGKKNKKAASKRVDYPLSDYYDEERLPEYDPAWETIPVWGLDLDQRRALHKHWKLQIVQKEREYLEKLSKEYASNCKTLKEIRDDCNLDILRKARVIGMTTTGAAKARDLIECLRPRVVIVEEAAEVLESSIITSISEKTEHLILIGDHQQLRPSTAVFELSKKFYLDVSLFERLIKCGLPYTQLSTQRRMRSDIAGLIAPIYPHLQSHPSVDKYPFIQGVQKSLFFLSHEVFEKDPQQGSQHHSNEFEAKMIRSFSRYLLQQTYKPVQITILTPYADQLLLLKDSLRSNQSTPGLDQIRVTTIDNYQGEENDIIILSLVRSNPVGSIGFLKTANRVTVALSRAKHGFFIFGNSKHLQQNSEFWDSVVHYLEVRSCIGPALRLQCAKHPQRVADVEKPVDFEKHALDGGCSQPCGERLNCGHICPKFCHPNSHDDFRCTRRCVKQFEGCGHPCDKLCFEDCGSCNTPVSKVIPKCGHTISIACSADPDDAKCPKPCERILPCGHMCDKLCGDVCQKKCRAKVPVVMPECHHTVEIECWKHQETKGAPLSCTHECGRPLVCAHSCKANCCKTNSPGGICMPCTQKCENRCIHSVCSKKCGEPCIPCVEPCAWACEHKKCSKLCSEPCDREPCNKPCKKRIPGCGHQCIGLCGETCPKVCRTCHPDVKDTIMMTELQDFDENDRFVQLDCDHVFECSGIDQWLNRCVDDSGPGAIQLPTCPNCKAPVRHTLRYGHVIKKALASIEAVKPLLLFRQFNDAARAAFEAKSYVVCMTKCIQGLTYAVSAEACGLLVKAAQMANLVEEALQKLKALRGGDQSMAVATAMALLHSSASRKEVAVGLIRQALILAEQEINKRNGTRNNLESTIYVAYGLYMLDEIPSATKLVGQVRQLSPQFKPAIELENDIHAMKTAVDLLHREDHVRSGAWYRCPNGHPYAIGECGGAMQSTTCPDCGVVVGGANHALASNNIHARVDGSQHAAWSEQNNLANFNINDLM